LSNAGKKKKLFKHEISFMARQDLSMHNKILSPKFIVKYMDRKTIKIVKDNRIKLHHHYIICFSNMLYKQTKIFSKKQQQNNNKRQTKWIFELNVFLGELSFIFFLILFIATMLSNFYNIEL